MDPAADKIRLIHQLLQLHLQQTNEKFNNQFSTRIKSNEDRAYNRYRRCLLERQGSNRAQECFQKMEASAMNINFRNHSQSLMLCIDQAMNLSEGINEKVALCAKNYQNKLTKQIRAQLLRIQKL